uniref:Uncharacterized protein n=1 Tax=Nothobranchius rachovii TaxID=451742 RepID=A0A1A8NGX4_9TELE
MEGCDEERDAHTQTECSRLTEERDEAQRQLKHIKRVSQMVIEEVSVLQTQLEIEKSCRENAEALATKLNCENRKLKYLSLTSRPCLDDLLPSISDCIPLEADGDAADNSLDTFTQYQQQVKDLRELVNSLLEEKKTFVCQIHEQQRQIEELTTQSETKQAEMKDLHETVEQQRKNIKRFNRVSMMAAKEYDGMKEQLDLEQNLRVKAETFAHEMLVKQKEANRQSMLLLQSAEPSIQLLKALEDVSAITKTLEEERLQHQQKVQSLEAQLQENCVQKQLDNLRRQLELLEEEKKEVEGRLEQAEKKNEELEKRVQELQETQMQLTATPSSAPGRTSSDSGKDSEGPGGLSVPSDQARTKVSPERWGSGPGPVVAPKKQRRSCSSLSEKEVAESLVSNGSISSFGEENQMKSNGVNHTDRGEDVSTEPVNVSADGDAEC